MVQKCVSFLYPFFSSFTFYSFLCTDIPHGFLHLFPQRVICIPEICNFFLKITLKKVSLLLKCLFLLLASDACRGGFCLLGYFY